MQEQLKQIKTEALAELQAVTDARELESLRIKYFGRKGQITAVMRGMGKLSESERPVVGKLANEVRTNAHRGVRSGRRDLECTSTGTATR